MTKDLVLNFLREEGYTPKVDDDGDVVFKAEGHNFLYFANEDDQDFFQLVMPGIYDVTDENREMVLEICNAVNFDIKVAKALIVNQHSDVWLWFENLLDQSPDVGDIMPRAIRILIKAQQAFYEKLG